MVAKLHVELGFNKENQKIILTKTIYLKFDISQKYTLDSHPVTSKNPVV